MLAGGFPHPQTLIPCSEAQPGNGHWGQGLPRTAEAGLCEQRSFASIFQQQIKIYLFFFLPSPSDYIKPSQGWRVSHGAVLLNTAPSSGLYQPRGSCGSARPSSTFLHS